MKIAIDVDEIIVGFVEKYMNFAADRGFKRVGYKDVYSYELEDVLETTREETIGLLKIFNLEGHHENLDFIEGAVEGVKLLIKKHDVYFITAQPKAISKFTRDFIFNNFRVLGDRVLFSGDTLREGEMKEEICGRLGIGLIIEDSEKDTLRYARGGMKVLLLDKPWNRSVEHKNVYRCRDWGEILERLEEVADV